MSVKGDEVAAHELVLFIENDADLYRQMSVPIDKNLINKKAAGKYNKTLALKAFVNLATEGAKRYHKQFGSKGDAWHKMFDIPTRWLAAKELLEGFESSAASGELDEYLYKKYQGKWSGRSRKNPRYFGYPAKRGLKNPRKHSATKAKVQKLVDGIQRKYDGDVWISFYKDDRIEEPHDALVISKIALPKSDRGQGTGTAVLRTIITFADKHALVIATTPTKDFGAPITRLRAFLKRHSFVNNKGRRKDFRFMQTMIRHPR